MFIIGDIPLEKDRPFDLQEIKLLRVEHLYKDGMSIANACKTIGISVHTYYKYRERLRAGSSQACVAGKTLSAAQELN